MLRAKNLHANHVELIFMKYKFIANVFQHNYREHTDIVAFIRWRAETLQACLAFLFFLFFLQQSVSQQPVVLGVKTAESHTADGVVPPEEQPVHTQTLFRLCSCCALMCHLLSAIDKT